MAPARRVLIRRNLFLILFGAVHAVLLFDGDILGAYGAIGLVVTLLFLRRSTRVLVVWLAAWLAVIVVVVVVLTVLGVPLNAGNALTAEAGYLHSAYDRAGTFGAGVLLCAVAMPLLGHTLIGVLMARVELLDRVWHHRAAFRRIAVTGISVGLLGGLPFALTVGGYWDPARR